MPVIPVTYMNSSADLKGFCGRHGGIVCTSSNATTVLEWAFARGRRVLFFPDQHLGRNTAKAMGVPLDRDADVEPAPPPRRLDGRRARRRAGDPLARLLLGAQALHGRADRRGPRGPPRRVQVIVHPECPMAVVDAADSYGSTDFIVKAIEAAPAGSMFAIGTEINLVQRLAQQYPQHTIFCLDSVVCPCSTMYRIHPGYIAWALEALVGTAERPSRGAQPHHGARGRRGSPPASRSSACSRPSRTTRCRCDPVPHLAPPRDRRRRIRSRRSDRRPPRVDALGHSVTLVTKGAARREQLPVRAGRRGRGGLRRRLGAAARVGHARGGGRALGAGRGRDAVRRRADREFRISRAGACASTVPRARAARFRGAVERSGGHGAGDAAVRWARGLEAAHSRARVLHAGGDATGAAIVRALVARLEASTVRILEHSLVQPTCCSRRPTSAASSASLC